MIDVDQEFNDEQLRRCRQEFPNDLYLLHSIQGHEEVLTNDGTLQTITQHFQVASFQGTGNSFKLVFFIKNFETKYCQFIIDHIKFIEGIEGFIHSDVVHVDTSFSNFFEQYESYKSNSVFSKQIYIFTDFIISDKRELINFFRAKGYSIYLRDNEFWDMKIEFLKTMEEERQPDFFLCHDSRDKPIARQLYEEMQILGLKVFFDEVSLELGDSLLQKLEDGIRTCTFGVILVTPNFLSNESWAKNLEYEGFINKYLADKKNQIVPIWHEVSSQEVRKLSYLLSGIVAGKTEDGYDVLARKLKAKLDKRKV